MGRPAASCTPRRRRRRQLQLGVGVVAEEALLREMSVGGGGVAHRVGAPARPMADHADVVAGARGIGRLEVSLRSGRAPGTRAVGCCCWFSGA